MFAQQHLFYLWVILVNIPCLFCYPKIPLHCYSVLVFFQSHWLLLSTVVFGHPGPLHVDPELKVGVNSIALSSIEWAAYLGLHPLPLTLRIFPESVYISPFLWENFEGNQHMFTLFTNLLGRAYWLLFSIIPQPHSPRFLWHDFVLLKHLIKFISYVCGLGLSNLKGMSTKLYKAASFDGNCISELFPSDTFATAHWRYAELGYYFQRLSLFKLSVPFSLCTASLPPTRLSLSKALKILLIY